MKKKQTKKTAMSSKLLEKKFPRFSKILKTFGGINRNNVINLFCVVKNNQFCSNV